MISQKDTENFGALLFWVGLWLCFTPFLPLGIILLIIGIIFSI